eukprot:6776948-Alexandrium_andersonii.AAC.1
MLRNRWSHGFPRFLRRSRRACLRQARIVAASVAFQRCPPEGPQTTQGMASRDPAERSRIGRGTRPASKGLGLEFSRRFTDAR